MSGSQGYTNQVFLQKALGVRPTEDNDRVGARFEECKVHHLTINGLYFTRPMFDNNKTVYGPASYTWPVDGTTGGASAGTAHTHDEPVPTNGPRVGQRCLIAWAVTVRGGMVPWVLGWSA